MMFRRLLAIMGLALVFCAGCPRETQDKTEKPGKLRAECVAPSGNCWDDCFKRDASRYCPSCCNDQTTLCDEGKPSSFEKCKQEP